MFTYLLIKGFNLSKTFLPSSSSAGRRKANGEKRKDVATHKFVLGSPPQSRARPTPPSLMQESSVLLRSVVVVHKAGGRRDKRIESFLKPPLTPAAAGFCAWSPPPPPNVLTDRHSGLFPWSAPSLLLFIRLFCRRSPPPPPANERALKSRRMWYDVV